MSVRDVWQFRFDFFSQKPVCVEPREEPLSTDGGLLIFRPLDEQHQWTTGFAAQLLDTRQDPTHSCLRRKRGRQAVLKMVRSRVFGILAGDEDQKDRDSLRQDPIFQRLADRSPEDGDWASQPTWLRFENSVSARSWRNLEEYFIDRFVTSFAEPPSEIPWDVDVLDDPPHGQQQLTFFPGFCDPYPSLERVLTCADNDLVLLPVLL